MAWQSPSPLLKKYFEPIPSYTACVCKGRDAGKVCEVKAISTSIFTAGQGLAYIEFDTGHWSVAHVETLERI